MKSVTVEFKNIQSHERTAFTLEPGLNFILANDNNVGKSTIFKMLMTIGKMPRVSPEELRELLRVGSNNGYAAFQFDGKTYVYWIYTEGEKINSFFEIRYGDGQTIRSYECPQELLDALDIVIGNDGTPINFNDADSVQLVVQDSQKNDEIISRILVDARVEQIKSNLLNMKGQMQTDLDVEQARVKDAQKILGSLRYNDAIDVFYDELSYLRAGCNVLDILDDLTLSEPRQIATADEIGLNRIQHSLDVLSTLSDLLTSTQLASASDKIEMSDEDAEQMQRSVELVATLESALKGASVAQDNPKAIQESAVANMSTAISILDKLFNAEWLACSALANNARYDDLMRKRSTIEFTLEQKCQVVTCPVKGEVYYSENGCIMKGGF